MPALPAVSSTQRDEQRFLAGLSTRRRELRSLWTVLRESRVLHFGGPCVSAFGAARVTLLLFSCNGA